MTKQNGDVLMKCKPMFKQEAKQSLTTCACGFRTNSSVVSINDWQKSVSAAYRIRHTCIQSCCIHLDKQAGHYQCWCKHNRDHWRPSLLAMSPIVPQT